MQFKSSLGISMTRPQMDMARLRAVEAKPDFFRTKAERAFLEECRRSLKDHFAFEPSSSHSPVAGVASLSGAASDRPEQEEDSAKIADEAVLFNHPFFHRRRSKANIAAASTGLSISMHCSWKQEDAEEAPWPLFHDYGVWVRLPRPDMLTYKTADGSVRELPARLSPVPPRHDGRLTLKALSTRPARPLVQAEECSPRWNNHLLSDLFAPKNISELLFWQAAIARILDPLSSGDSELDGDWLPHDLDNLDSRPRQSTRIFMLSGPTATGKTLVAKLVSAHLERPLLEINATSWRTAKSFDAIWNEAARSKSVVGISALHAGSMERGSGTLLKTQLPIVLIDDVDVIFEEDKGFWAALDQFLRHSRTTIILTCNCDPSLVVGLVKSLESACVFTIGQDQRVWGKEGLEVLADRLAPMLDLPGTPLLRAFTEYSRAWTGDMRAIANHVHFYGGTTKDILDCEKMLGYRNDGGWSGRSGTNMDNATLGELERAAEHQSFLDGLRATLAVRLDSCAKEQSSTPQLASVPDVEKDVHSDEILDFYESLLPHDEQLTRQTQTASAFKDPIFMARDESTARQWPTDLHTAILPYWAAIEQHFAKHRDHKRFRGNHNRRRSYIRGISAKIHEILLRPRFMPL